MVDFGRLGQNIGQGLSNIGQGNVQSAQTGLQGVQMLRVSRTADMQYYKTVKDLLENGTNNEGDYIASQKAYGTSAFNFGMGDRFPGFFAPNPNNPEEQWLVTESMDVLRARWEAKAAKAKSDRFNLQAKLNLQKTDPETASRLATGQGELTKADIETQAIRELTEGMSARETLDFLTDRKIELAKAGRTNITIALSPGTKERLKATQKDIQSNVDQRKAIAKKIQAIEQKGGERGKTFLDTGLFPSEASKELEVLDSQLSTLEDEFDSLIKSVSTDIDAGLEEKETKPTGDSKRFTIDQLNQMKQHLESKRGNRNLSISDELIREALTAWGTDPANWK